MTSPNAVGADLPVDIDRAMQEARAVLLRNFGYSDFRPPQVRAVEAVLSGRDALIVLPTGGGKSLCFQVPALMRSGLTVVVSPLISLMKDQVDALERRGVPAAFINSTLTTGEVAERMARAQDGTIRLLYLAPERLEAGRMLQHLADIGVALLAVDEAHCISEWGHDFRPSYRRIGLIRSRLGTPQTVALTATATPEVRADISEQLLLRTPTIVIGGFDRTNLAYHVEARRTQQDKDVACVQLLRSADGPSIVYAPTRKAVERITTVLVESRVRAVAYHGGLDDSRRQRAQEAFMEVRSRVIVATSAFGMGIDKPDVRLVVHHAMPGSLESYYQEAGRAGRDGAPSTCVLLYAYPDRHTHEHFIAGSNPARALVECTWHVLHMHADGSGAVALGESEIAALMPSRVGARGVGAALRVLIASNAIRVRSSTRGCVSVRLLATAERVKRELIGPREIHRTLLRAMWRQSGPALDRGTSVDLRNLPRTLGGVTELERMLDQLQAGQFVTWTKRGAALVLDPRIRRTHLLPVDWRQLERRRVTEHHRLDAMQGYAQTKHCRRAFVLRYFGDPAARPRCAACDRCSAHTERHGR